MLNSDAARKLLANATSERELVVIGGLTKPRTWGVYEIKPTGGSRATRQFRMGNHPVRQRELELEFGQVRRIALFTSRAIAVELERLLNQR